MTFNLEFFQKFQQIVYQIYDYFVSFSDSIINKTVLQSYAAVSNAVQDVLGPLDSALDVVNPFQFLKLIADYVVISGIGNTPLASMPTIVFLLSAFITFSLGIAVLKLFK